MTIMIGTANQAKLSFFDKLLQGYDVQIIGTQGLSVPPPEENGKDPLENAILKAEYYGRYAPVTIGVDSGLYFNELPLTDPRQPGLHIRSPHSVRLDDEEMIDFYTARIHELGGRVTAYYLDGTAVHTSEGTFTFLPTQEELLSTAFTMTDQPVPARKPGWPLDSLSYDRNGVQFLDPTRVGLAQVSWGYAPRLRHFLADLLHLKNRPDPE